MRKAIWLLSIFTLWFLPAQTDGTLVVLNKSDDTVDFINLSTGKSERTLPTGDGPHEVAISTRQPMGGHYQLWPCPLARKFTHSDRPQRKSSQQDTRIGIRSAPWH